MITEIHRSKGVFDPKPIETLHSKGVLDGIEYDYSVRLYEFGYTIYCNQTVTYVGTFPNTDCLVNYAPSQSFPNVLKFNWDQNNHHLLTNVFKVIGDTRLVGKWNVIIEYIMRTNQFFRFILCFEDLEDATMIKLKIT